MYTRFKTITAITAALMISATASFADPITFEDVYAAPDNAVLNLAYANQEISKGDLLSAANALERLLLSQPNLDSVRLLYAKVLFMLDDKAAAARELDVLKGRSLSPENAQTMNQLKKQVGATS